MITTADVSTWLSSKEAARRLGISPWTLIRALDSGESLLRFTDVSAGATGRRILVDPASIEAAVAAGGIRQRAPRQTAGGRP